MNSIELTKLSTPAVQQKLNVPAVDPEIMAQAREFESVFIAQMLNYSGLAKAISSEGGFGSDAFSGMLLEQYANHMVEGGGFGLADHIYEQLVTREGKNDPDTIA